MQLGKYSTLRLFASLAMLAVVLLFARVVRSSGTAKIDNNTPKVFSLGADGPSNRAKSSSQLSPSFLDCMQDVGRHLPIRKADGELVAHHFLAGRQEWWNEGIRFDPFGATLPDAPLILDIGGNTEAADSRQFIKMYPAAEIHIYEPVSPYVEKLRQNWRDELNQRVQVHGVGLGDRDKTIRLPRGDLDGQGTFIMDSKEGQKEDNILLLQVVDAKDELRNYFVVDADGHSRQRIDLLHMNCEGCEWEALTRLMETDMFQYIGVLQVSFHNYGAAGIGDLLPKYCLIREALEQTHKKVDAIPFGWERWVHKTLAATLGPGNGM
jgi:FkbM family methyltransferase